MSNKETLRELAGKAPADLTRQDKALITKLSSELGVPFTPAQRCANCYSDQAIILYNKIKGEEKAGTYTLKQGVDVIFRGQRINADTLSDQLAKKLLATGFPPYLFV